MLLLQEMFLDGFQTLLTSYITTVQSRRASFVILNGLQTWHAPQDLDAGHQVLPSLRHLHGKHDYMLVPIILMQAMGTFSVPYIPLALDM